MSEFRQCIDCNQALSIDQFYTYTSRGKSYTDLRCRACKRDKRKARLASRPDLRAARRIASTKWYTAHRHTESFRLRSNAEKARRFAILRAVFYEVFGEVCVRCGFSDKRALQIDHINGDSRADRQRFGTYNATYIRHVIRSGRDRYQLLCSNCNWIKRYEEGHHSKPFVLDNLQSDVLYAKYKRQLVLVQEAA